MRKREPWLAGMEGRERSSTGIINQRAYLAEIHRPSAKYTAPGYLGMSAAAM